MKELLIILCYTLSLFGMSQMFIYFNGPFDIIEKWRKFAHWLHPKFGELFTCVFCFSTWSGLIGSVVDYFLVPIEFTPFNIFFGSTGLWWLIFPLDMFFGCGTVWLWHQLDEYLEKAGKGGYKDDV